MREFVGRVVVVFGFNEAVANGLGLATKRTPLRSLRAHLAHAGRRGRRGRGPLGRGLRVGRDGRRRGPPLPRLVAAVVTTILSQAGLWAEVYLITGMVMDAIHGRAPSASIGRRASRPGHEEGDGLQRDVHGRSCTASARSGRSRSSGRLAAASPVLAAMLFGALAFPLVKTIIETFDGSQAFFRRVAAELSEARSSTSGARWSGSGLGYGADAWRWPSEDAADPGLVRLRRRGRWRTRGSTSCGDVLEAARGRGRVQSWRVYLVHALLGGFIGAAIGFYLDAAQVAVVVAKFHRYLAAGRPPEPFDVYPLLSKWGFINLGTVTGGVSLLFAEALAGVISWSIPAWLFAINRTFMAAYFRKETAPIRALFTRDGLVQLTREHDRGPALGPVDVADHQVVPAADGRADLVQPGRRDPHRCWRSSRT